MAMRSPFVRLPTAAFLAWGILVSSFVVAAPRVGATGSDPAFTGNYELVRDIPLKSDTKSEHFLRVAKLSNEADPDYDWYLLVLTIRQLDDSDISWDFANFWIAPFAYGNERPQQVDWDPGTQNTGEGSETFSVGMSGSGPSAGVSWTHHWGMDWEINERFSQDSGEWRGHLHHERGETNTIDDWEFDWNRLSFASAYKVDAHAKLGVNVGTQIRYVDDGVFDCWYPCHSQGTECSPCTWFVIAPGQCTRSVEDTTVSNTPPDQSATAEAEQKEAVAVARTDGCLDYASGIQGVTLTVPAIDEIMSAEKISQSLVDLGFCTTAIDYLVAHPQEYIATNVPDLLVAKLEMCGA